MYIGTDINIERPLCDCYYNHNFSSYNWQIIADRNQKLWLRIYCPNCGIDLRVPPQLFKARIKPHNFDYARKYPGKSNPKEEEKPKLKVLEFPEPKRTQSPKD